MTCVGGCADIIVIIIIQCTTILITNTATITPGRHSGPVRTDPDTPRRPLESGIVVVEPLLQSLLT